MHHLTHILEHSLLDTLKIIPFIFLIYVLIEYLEHKNNTLASHFIMKKSVLSPVFGALLGSLPQCGFSVIAADLFSRGSLSLGTLIAIFIATSDEAVPIILANPSMAHMSLKLIGIKVIIAVIFGVLIDLIFKNRTHSHTCPHSHQHEHFHGNCENCEGGLWRSAIIHTLKLFAFIFICNLILGLAIENLGIDNLARYAMKDSFVQPLITPLIGLIPNCAASVFLTGSFLTGALSFASLVSGLVSGAGVGILVLFKHNKNIKQNLLIVLALYCIGALSGLVIHFIF